MGYATSPTFPSGKLSRSQILVNPSAEQETTLCGTAWEQSCQSYGSITKVKWKKFVLINGAQMKDPNPTLTQNTGPLCPCNDRRHVQVLRSHSFNKLSLWYETKKKRAKKPQYFHL